MSNLTRLSLAVARLSVPEYLPVSYLLEQLTLEAEDRPAYRESNRRLGVALYRALEAEDRPAESYSIRDALDYFRALEAVRA